MEVTDELRHLLRKKRKELKYTIQDVVDKSSPTGSKKPSISVSTVSSIERGDLKNVKQDTFDLIAGILGLTVSENEFSVKPIRVAFGPCCWAAPIINAVVKDSNKVDEPLQLHELSLTCYARDNNKPEFLSMYNQSPQGNHQILTANETLAFLQNDEVDIAFLPVLTAKRATGISRIARCMNTAKGGVYLFIVGKKGKNGQKSDLEQAFSPSDNYGFDALRSIKNDLEGKNPQGEKKVESISDEKHCCFLYPKGTMGQEVVETTFGETIYSKYEIEISSTTNFIHEIVERVDRHFEENTSSKYLVFAGWDYHIDKLKKEFSGTHITKNKKIELVGREFDSFRFTKYGHPFTMMSYDCVTLESKYDYLQKHPGLSRLLSMLSENVNELNNAKFKINHPRYRLINKFLQMEQKTTDAVLNRINWEFLVYPEMFNKNLK